MPCMARMACAAEIDFCRTLFSLHGQGGMGNVSDTLEFLALLSLLSYFIRFELRSEGTVLRSSDAIVFSS